MRWDAHDYRERRQEKAHLAEAAKKDDALSPWGLNTSSGRRAFAKALNISEAIIILMKFPVAAEILSL